MNYVKATGGYFMEAINVKIDSTKKRHQGTIAN